MSAGLHCQPAFRGEGWALRRTGRSRAFRIVRASRLVAWRECRRLARGAGVKAYLHDKTGLVVARNDYGR